MRTVTRLLLVALVLVVVWALFFAEGGVDVEPGSVLLLDVQGEYVEASEPPLLARLLGEARTPLLRLYSDLRKAERDDRLHAVVLRIRPVEMGWAKAQEVRDAILRMREAGRRTVAFVEVEPFSANLEYYMASAAERVYVAPGTRIPFAGLAAEYLFLGGLWDKVGVDLEVERVGPHKTAADFLAGREMSEAHREMANWLLDSIDAQFVGDIAASRGMDEAALREVIDAAPAAPEDLIQAGLVDRVGFLSDVLEELGDDRPLIESEDWARVDPASVGFEPLARVALVYGSGNVVHGEAERTRSGVPVLASTTVSQAIEGAAEDEDIDAILFRIDSPGGSALASDVVWHATQQARREKPLVVSFSDVAASGGYYVACGADGIVAQPGTITGSIGVLMVRPVIRRMYEKLGIGVETLLRGEHADLFTTSRTLDDDDRKWLGAEVERTYQLFLDRVVAGRQMERARLDGIARGRVWTGAQARERGLVDDLGGLHAAVGRLREALELAPDADVELVVFPPPKRLAEELRDMLQGAVAQAAQPPLPLPRPVRRMLSWLETLPLGAPALLPPLVLEIR
jgi:protease-4